MHHATGHSLAAHRPMVVSRMPLPAKITVEVLPAIDLAAALGAAADADEGYALVTERMQDAPAQLAEARAFPVIG